MTEKILVWLLTTVLLGTVSADAQQPTKIRRIGYLSANSASSESVRTDALRQGLRELGYVEEKKLSLNIDLQRENSMDLPSSWPS